MGSFIFDPLTGDPTILSTDRSKRPDQTGAVGTNGTPASNNSQNTVSQPTVPVPNGVKVSEISLEDASKVTSNSNNATGQDQGSAANSQNGAQSASQPKPKIDFFAKGNEHLTPPALYQDADDWNVRVIANKYPIIGDHEVVIHSPDSNKDIDELSNEQVTRIVRAYLNRLHAHTNEDKEVFIFNNRGHKAGASLDHPHSQIVALKGFPGTTQKEKESALRYYDEHNTCYWCDEIKDAVAETDPNKSRVVIESTHFVAITPKASRWPYEVRLTPKTHRPNFGMIDEPEINDFAVVLKKLLQIYGKAFNYPDRNFWIRTQRYDPFHWHVGFLPHLKVFGALELGAGIWVNDKASPEDAAKLLRENIVS